MLRPLNVEQFNKWLSLLGNVAVVAGLFFLVLELNQNNRMMKTQTRTAITESILNFQYNSVSSGLLDLAAKANADPATLTPVEVTKLVQYYVSNLRLWENIHYQYRNAVFDEAEFAAERNSWRGLGERSRIMQLVYCGLRERQALSPAFVAELDQLGYGAPEQCGMSLPGISFMGAGPVSPQ